MIELVKAGTSDVLVINSISKRSFDSDVEVGASSKGGPPGYMSIQFHTKMARLNHLYKLLVDAVIQKRKKFINVDMMRIAEILHDPNFKKLKKRDVKIINYVMQLRKQYEI